MTTAAFAKATRPRPLPRPRCYDGACCGRCSCSYAPCRSRCRPKQAPLDRAARQWVDATLKKLSLEQLAGQMVFAPFQSTYLSSDSDSYDELVKLIRESHIGGVIAFGGSEAGAAGDAQFHVWRGDSWPADGAGLDSQPLAVDLGVAAADLVGFRVGRADAHCRRHEIPARDGVWRHRRSAAGV